MGRMGYFEILCGAVIFFFLLYRYLTATYDFWKKRGIPGPDPELIFGSVKDIILRRVHSDIYFKRLYDTYHDTQFIGLFDMRKPMLLIKDPKHIKDIFIKDSSIFSTRGATADGDPRLFEPFFFFLHGPLAVPLRTKMSPSFTPNKIKQVFFTMQESFTRFDHYMDALLLHDDCVNCSDVGNRLIIDLMATSLMGIDLKTLSTEMQEKDKFLANAPLFFDTNIRLIFKKLFSGMLPQLYDLIGYRLFDTTKKLRQFYVDFILDLMEYRKKHNIVKPDFVNLLMQLKENPDKLNEIIEVTDEFYGAHMFGIFFAGLETTISILINALYEIALNQNMQDKLRDEIRNLYSENAEITNDALNSMPYLDKVFKETMRKYPPGDLLIRKSISNYTFRDTKLTIPEGHSVIVPIYAIHHDPNIYPKPEEFDPERFSDEAVRSRDPMHYIPFGHGIRNCIGERLGILQVKLGLIAFLRKYKLDVCEETNTSFKYRIILSPQEKIYLKVTKIDLF